MDDFSEVGKAELKLDEGFRSKPYKCTAGYLTIGWGHNLDANGIKTKFLQTMYDDDCDDKVAEMKRHAALAWIFDDGQMNQVRRDAFVNLAFNLGVNGLANFVRTLQAARECDWHWCANELKGSKWYGQVGRRGPRIVNQIETGTRI